MIRNHSSLLLIMFVVIVSLQSCNTPNEPNDDIPPTVTITTPPNNSTVSEVINITCVATDNEGISQVELWVDGISGGVTDNTEPYALDWNTTTYDNNTVHTITIRAHDVNGNKTDSNPIYLTIDNSNSNPNKINIVSVKYTLTEMTIVWGKSVDQDFEKYELFYSDTEQGIKTLLVSKAEVIDTVFILTEFDPSHENWFWVKIYDIYGYSTMGDAYRIKDELPQVTQIFDINFQYNSFHISWSMNSENDFLSYSLYESLNFDMSNESLIYHTYNRTDTSFVVAGVDTNEFRYYRLIVTDYWHQETLSSIKKGSSFRLLALVFVSGGTFTMGDIWGYGSLDELPTHSVTLSPFYIGKFEVTQSQWEYITGTNPSLLKSENRPVENIDWYRAIHFCNSLSLLEGFTPCYSINGNSISWDISSNGYRLPTEAEWEFAARGGNLSQLYLFSGSYFPDTVAWYVLNSNNVSHDVGTKGHNELGIYDMSGNVWEFCWDWYGSYPADPETNPTGPSGGTVKVVRGGAFHSGDQSITVSVRGTEFPGSSGGSDYIGFRVVRSF